MKKEVKTIQDLTGLSDIDLIRVGQNNKVIPVLEMLAEHNSAIVRLSVSKNIHITRSIVDTLLKNSPTEPILNNLTRNEVVQKMDGVLNLIKEARKSLLS